MTPTYDLAFCYQCLSISTEATLEDVDQAYFLKKAEAIRSGDRTQVTQLKAARETLRKHLLSTAPNPGNHHATASEDESASALDAITAALASEGFKVKASLKEQTLHLGVKIDPTMSSSQLLAKVRHCLREVPVEQFSFEAIATINLYGLNEQQKPQWKKSFSPPQQHSQKDDTDLYSFDNRYSNTFIFPALLLVAAMLNIFEPIKLMLFGVHIWIHEFGHATVAWLGGHQATPLPFGWTNVGAEQSLFVYCGVLTLFGLLFWSGIKEKRKWPMGLAIALTTLQFFMTWVISPDTFDMLLSFGGIGGEFYLSTLLIISFYFPLPEYWRWDFFRYPAVVFAGFTF